MSRSFAGVPNNFYNPSDNMDRPTAQKYACDSTSSAGSSSQASQTYSHTSTSHRDAIQRYSCSLPLVNNSSYSLSPPPIDNTWAAASFGFEFGGFPSEPHWGIDEDPIENLTGLMDGYLADENYTKENAVLSRSFQGHESAFNANNATPSREFPGYSTSLEPLIPKLELGDYRYSTSSRTKGGHASSDNGSGRGRSKNSPASQVTYSKKYTNDSDGNSKDQKVTKTKKTYQCTEYNCGKTFGRSAELKRHKSSVHRERIAARERQELFNCHHEGCERVGEAGFKRKDNLVQHLRGVHGDQIGKKSGRRSVTTMSPYSSASNAGAGSPTMATGYEQLSQDQQPFAYMNQQPVAQEESGSPPLVGEFWEGVEGYFL